MSSIIRSASQIPLQSKFLIGLQDVCGDTVAESSAFVLNDWPGTLATAQFINDNATILLGSIANNLYRDLGRQIMIVNDDDSHRALFREVLPQNGPGLAPIWVCVWDAAGNQASAARTG